MKTSKFVIVPILMIVGAVLSTGGSWLLWYSTPSDTGSATLGEMIDKVAADRRRRMGKIGFLLLMLGGIAQLLAGLYWYFFVPAVYS
jgi:ABC-type multidrug transport system fused ATPase/permease subunit